MIVIKNGFIIENNKLVNKDVFIKDSIIEKISDTISSEEYSLDNIEVLDAKGCIVMPGAVDVHVHLREPGFTKKETVKTGALSSAKGGVTTIMSMPNLNPCPDDVDSINLQLDIINKDAVVNVYPFGSVTVDEKDMELADIDNFHHMVKAISDDGRGVNNIKLLKKAMRLAKKYDLVIASHAEDNNYGLAPEGEYVAVRREIEFAKEVGCKYHFCHMSTKESFDAIRKAKAEGYTNITCEIAPHHLVMNSNDIKNANWKMNPPLREEADRLATVEALLDGTCDVIASDHAPHTEEEKSRKYDECPNGIIGLETMIPIIYTNFVKNELISLDKFLELLVYNPIKIFKLPERKLEVGYAADITCIDIENAHVYTKDEILSMGKNTPFIGNEYYGFTKYTLVNGKVVYEKD